MCDAELCAEFVDALEVAAAARVRDDVARPVDVRDEHGELHALVLRARAQAVVDELHGRRLRGLGDGDVRRRERVRQLQRREAGGVAAERDDVAVDADEFERVDGDLARPADVVGPEGDAPRAPVHVAGDARVGCAVFGGVAGHDDDRRRHRRRRGVEHHERGDARTCAERIGDVARRGGHGAGGGELVVVRPRRERAVRPVERVHVGLVKSDDREDVPDEPRDAFGCLERGAFLPLDATQLACCAQALVDGHGERAVCRESTARRNFAGSAKFRGFSDSSRKVRVCVACGVWQYAGIGKAFFYDTEIKTVRNVLVEKTFLTVFTLRGPPVDGRPAGAGVASLRVQCIPGAFLIDE